MFEKYLKENDIDKKLLSEEDYYKLLSEYTGMELIQLFPYTLNIDLIKNFNEGFIKKYKFIPLREDEQYLEICISQEKDLNLLDDLKRMYPNKKIKCKLALKSSLENIIAEIFDKKTLIDSINQIESDEIKEATAIDVNNIENSAGARQFINQMIKDAISKNASDIHINPNIDDINIKFRIDGYIIDYQTLNKVALNTLLTCLKIDSKLDISERRRPQDGQISIIDDNRVINLRLAFMNTVNGEKATIRILNDKISSMQLEELGLQDENLIRYRELITKPYGVILLTGPTGSGKTTTLYTTIRELNTGEKTIITIEDPVEYKLDGIVQTEVNPNIELSFASGLRSILRQDPDILLIGEIRDEETAEIAMRAANTGHLVFSTLHTNDAVSSIVRLKDMGIQDYIIGSTVLGIVNQRLIRKVCNSCKVEHKLEPDAKERYIYNIPKDEEFSYYIGEGCQECNYTGYKGRTLIQEMIIIDKEFSNLISSGADITTIYDYLKKQGFKTLKDDAFNKVKNGITNFEEVLKYAI